MTGDQVSTESGASTDTGATGQETKTGPEWSMVNWAIIFVFTILTLAGIALSVGQVEPVVKIEGNGTDTATIPLYVYLYAGLGALGYIFTKLMAELDQYTKWSKLEQLGGMAMRIPAAWVLAAGIYLFAGALEPRIELDGARFIAGAAFLVGLYVNVALKALGSLADRVLGRAPPESE